MIHNENYVQPWFYEKDKHYKDVVDNNKNVHLTEKKNGWNIPHLRNQNHLNPIPLVCEKHPKCMTNFLSQWKVGWILFPYMKYKTL